MSKDNVVFLAHRNPTVKSDYMEYLSCPNCQNKTFTLTHMNSADFPTLKCACCGDTMGVMGWIQPEDQ